MFPLLFTSRSTSTIPRKYFHFIAESNFFTITELYFFFNYRGQSLNKCDRAVIYLFIAVCYSPWLFLIDLPGDELFVHLRWLIWVLALTGVLFELVSAGPIQFIDSKLEDIGINYSNFAQQTISMKHRILAVVFYVLYGVVPALVLDSQVC